MSPYLRGVDLFYAEAYRRLLDHFKTGSLEGFGCEDLKLAVPAAGALIRYLQDTQKSTLEHINTITTFHVQNSMLLDHATVRSLELVQSSDGERKNSLLDLLDLSQTPMGARRIREWILKPLIDLETISKRLNWVETFKNNLILRQNIQEQFKSMYDLERLLGRISLSACNARDLIALKTSVSVLPRLLQLFDPERDESIQTLHGSVGQP